MGPAAYLLSAAIPLTPPVGSIAHPAAWAGRRIEPRLLMSLERHVGPGVMRMGCVMETFWPRLEEAGEVALEIHPSYLKRIDSMTPSGSGGRSALGIRKVDRL